MLNRHTSILLGNGPNRLAEAAVSWKDVLQQLVALASLPKGRAEVERPLPLLFDEISLAIKEDGGRGSHDLRIRIADVMRPLAPNSVHRMVMALGLEDILTTNYDYTLESAANRAQSHEGPSTMAATESKFSLFRRRDAGTSRVWHIHGELDSPRTIQLGYEHYGAYLGRIHAYLTDGSGGQLSPFARGDSQFEKTRRYSWIDVFLRNDIHIIGLTLDFSEIDLWWLIIYKERLRRKCRKQVGTTTYHHIHVGKVTPADRSRLAALEGVGVKPVSLEIDGEWEYAGAYHNILRSLKGSRARTR